MQSIQNIPEYHSVVPNFLLHRAVWISFFQELRAVVINILQLGGVLVFLPYAWEISNTTKKISHNLQMEGRDPTQMIRQRRLILNLMNAGFAQ